jgi:hypothetical protein
MTRLRDRRSLAAVVIVGIMIGEGFVATQGDADSKNRPAAATLTVIDSANRMVGPLLSPGSVGLRIDKVWFVAQIFYEAIRPSAGFRIVYTTTDCSGTEYLEAREVPAQIVGFSTAGGNPPFRYFYPRDIQEIAAAATRGVDALGTVDSCQPFIEPQVIPAGVMTDIDLPYQAPFTLR